MPDRKNLLLRLDPRVHDAIAKWAADDLRSVNAQIEYALRLALRTAGRTVRPAQGDGGTADGRTTGPAGDGRATPDAGPDSSESGGPDSSDAGGPDSSASGPGGGPESADGPAGGTDVPGRGHRRRVRRDDT